MASTLQKAYLETESGTRIDCLFNPNRFEFSMANRWTVDQLAGKGAPDRRFAGGASGSFDLSLVFDTTDTGAAVTDHTNKLVKLMDVDTSIAGYDASKNNGRPQWVKFRWGSSIHTFKAIVTSLKVTFTYFSNEGKPLRANVEMHLEQYEPDPNWGNQNPTSSTPKPSRSHQVQVGDSLDRIAARYYGDPTAWREIANANGVRDPLDLRPGTLIAIPERLN